MQSSEGAFSHLTDFPIQATVAAIKVIASIISEEEQGFLPFALLLKVNGQLEIIKFHASQSIEMIERIIPQLVTNDHQACATVYDGRITIDGQKYDAAILSIYEVGKEQGLRLLQRYLPPTPTQKQLTAIDNPIFGGNIPSLLT